MSRLNQQFNVHVFGRCVRILIVHYINWIITYINTIAQNVLNLYVSYWHKSGIVYNC